MGRASYSERWRARLPRAVRVPRLGLRPVACGDWTVRSGALHVCSHVRLHDRRPPASPAARRVTTGVEATDRRDSRLLAAWDSVALSLQVGATSGSAVEAADRADGNRYLSTPVAPRATCAT